MTFVFWQNILSIHQSAFMTSLAEKHDVIVVVEQEIDSRRSRHGWEIPNYGSCEIIVSPNSEIINYLLSISNSVHTFSGIGSYNNIHKVFKEAIKRKLNVGIMSEPFSTKGIKGNARILKHYLFFKKYGKYVNFLLAIGKKARSYFESLKFPKSKIYDWGYFTEIKDICLDDNDNCITSKSNLIFIGSIDNRKNILELVRICLRNEELYDSFTIIGGGNKEGELLELIKNKKKINFLGQLPNNEIHAHLSKADLCILPSLFDGWGAVVNESLMVGVPVIASNNCGASILLDGKVRGNTFYIKYNNLEEVLKKWLNNGKSDPKLKCDIMRWSRENISGTTAAKYFLEVIDFTYTNRYLHPKAPWLVK